jgi:hypothetical protein
LTAQQLFGWRRAEEASAKGSVVVDAALPPKIAVAST